MFGRNAKKNELNDLVKAHVEAQTFSGVVLVAYKGKIIYQAARGLAHRELNVPLNLDQRFNIGSIGKMITALAVLGLESQQELTLDDPLSDYLPNFPDGNAITLHHLLSNTAGLPDYLLLDTDDESWYAVPHTPKELLKRIEGVPRTFAPGEDFAYSNSNWVALALVVGQVTGLSWRDALRELVFTPFSLNETVVGTATEVILKRVTGYRLEAGNVCAALPINPTVELGAGGLFSTAGDLLKLAKILSTPQFGRMVPGTSDTYGYGVMSGERWGRSWYGHSGGTFGFSSFLTHYPEDNLTVIVLSNFENGSAATLEQALAAAVLDEVYTLPDTQSVVELSPDSLEKHCGTYQSMFMGRPVPFEVKREAGTLTVKFPFLAKTKLQALSETRFTGRLKGGEVMFDFHADGVTLDWAGEGLECPRL